MLRSVWILVGDSLYDVKRYFSVQFAAALARYGVQSKIIDLLEGDPQEKLALLFEQERPDLCCSFFSKDIIPAYQFWAHHRVPFWMIFTDPPVGYVKDPDERYFFYSCCDHIGCEYLKKRGFDNVFFFGHAIDKEIAPLEHQERPYDVVYLGTSYDPEGTMRAWKALPEPSFRILKETVELYLSDHRTPCWQALENIIPLSLSSSYNELYSYAETYGRGLDRLELIRSIQDATVHVYGGAVFRPPNKVKGWAEYFAGNPNIVVHPSIRYDEALEVMKKAKLCLNSMPFFKEGTHERLFMGAACGCMMINTDTQWVRDHFMDGEDLVLYRPYHWEEVNDKVNYYLAHEEERAAIAARGRNIVMQDHTWDKRVEELMQVAATLAQFKR